MEDHNGGLLLINRARSVVLADKAEQQSDANTQPQRSQHEELSDVEPDSAHHQKTASKQ